MDLPILETLEALFAEKKSKFVFETCAERKLFPTHCAPDRLSNDLAPIRGPPNIGPGSYEVDAHTNMLYTLNKKPCSTLGCGPGARTAKMFREGYKDETPDPTQYQRNVTQPKTFQHDYKPFKQGSDRNSGLKADTFVAPGVGTYEHDAQVNRKVEWHQSFGSSPINLPSVEQKSTILRNTDKLLSTKEGKKYQRRLAYLKLYY